MPASPLEVLTDELALVAGRIEREATLRIDGALAELRRIDAERELRLANLERTIAERLAAVSDGKSVTVDDVQPLIDEAVSTAVAALPVPKDGEPGRSVTVDDVAPLVAGEVARAVAALPPAEPGKSVTVDDMRPLIDEAVSKAVAALPAPKDGAPGQSVTIDDVAPLIEEAVSRAVAALPKPEKGDKGEPGRDGRLPVAKEWTDRVYYEGEVAIRSGSTWQASRDTGRAPPHEDWVCLAAAGSPGRDGRSPRVRETYSAEISDYCELDIVALGGAAFIARRDKPGPCPGAGWQVISTQGKTGKPGDRGGPGPRGPAGPSIAQMSVDGQGLLTLVNADSSVVECDLYPVLAKLA